MADNYDRLRWGGLLAGSCRMAVLSLLVAAASGCGGIARKPSAILEKYFPSQNPEQALVGFVFAIESFLLLLLSLLQPLAERLTATSIRSAPMRLPRRSLR